MQTLQRNKRLCRGTAGSITNQRICSAKLFAHESLHEQSPGLWGNKRVLLKAIYHWVCLHICAKPNLSSRSITKTEKVHGRNLTWFCQIQAHYFHPETMNSAVHCATQFWVQEVDNLSYSSLMLFTHKNHCLRMQRNALECVMQWKHRIKLRSVPGKGKIPSPGTLQMSRGSYRWRHKLSFFSLILQFLMQTFWQNCSIKIHCQRAQREMFQLKENVLKAMSHLMSSWGLRKIKRTVWKRSCASHLCRIKTGISWNRSSLNGPLFKFICNVVPGRKREKNKWCLSSSSLIDTIWIADNSPKWKLSLARKKKKAPCVSF